MTYLGNVDSEGGPLLVADATVAREWRGAESGSVDFEAACDLLDGGRVAGGPLTVGGQRALIWDLAGAGTADVFVDDRGSLVIVRSWLDDASGEEETTLVTSLAAAPRENPIQLGQVEITSGILAILWSLESGEAIEALNTASQQRPTGLLSSQSSGLLAALPLGSYLCLHDEARVSASEARRCHLVRESQTENLAASL